MDTSIGLNHMSSAFVLRICVGISALPKCRKIAASIAEIFASGINGDEKKPTLPWHLSLSALH